MKNKVAFMFVITISILCIMISQKCYGAVNTFDNNVLRIGFDPNLPPYQYYDNGEYKGFNIDLINYIAQKNSINIELIPMPTNEALQKFKNGKIDMILGIRYNHGLESIMEVSDSLVQSTVSLIMLNEKVNKIKSILNSEPLVIAVERGSIEFEFVKNIKKANYNLAFNQESVMNLMLMGRADMMIGVRHVAEFMLEKYGLTNKYTVSNTYETPVDYYLGIRKEYADILNLFNTELRNLKINGGYEKIYNKWINDKNLEKQKHIVKFLMIFLTLVFLITFGSIFINLQLKKKINDKTKALSFSNKKLEEKITEIRQSNELKNLIVESSPRSIVIFDNEGFITLMNENSLKICGCSKPLIGSSVYNLIPVNIMLENNIERVLKYGESYMGKEMEYDSGERKWTFRYVIYPLYDYENKTRGAIITIEDITDEKILRAQAEEKEKNRVLSQIISGIAHEIRNPLTSIKTYVELLPRKKDNIEFQKQITTVVPHEVERVNKLIEQLIDYAKPRKKSNEFVELRELAESCILLFEPVAEKNDISINANIYRNMYIDVDKNQIKQVIINLILNSMDAINEMKEENNKNGVSKKYRIEINSFNLKDSIVISIEDNGIGMTEDEVNNVFELFYTTKTNGSGIGLPLSKQIIEENGGIVKIKSKKYIGTRILITFKGAYNEKETVDNR